MAITVDAGEAETRLPELLERVRGGEEVIIAKSGKPIARLVPVVDRPGRRTPGSAAGQVIIAPDFDAPLPDELLAGFEK